jgi:RNA polymerase sigma-70 factor, ECF subfamily
MEAGQRPPAVRVPGGFDAFYRTEYAAVVGLVHALTGNRAAAEDLAQEAFLRAHRDWHRVGTMDAPRAWVRVVAANLARSRFRRLRSEMVARLRLSPPPAVQPFEPGAEAFWAEVRRLPARQAQAIALRYVDDLTVGEIAAALGAAEGTVRALLHQGRQRLKRQLAAKGWVDHGLR